MHVFMCLKIFMCAFFLDFCFFFKKTIVHIFAFFASADRKSRYIRYRDNIGDNQYGESYNIGNKQYSSKNISYCPIHRYRFHSLLTRAWPSSCRCSRFSKVAPVGALLARKCEGPSNSTTHTRPLLLSPPVSRALSWRQRAYP